MECPSSFFARFLGGPEKTSFCGSVEDPDFAKECMRGGWCATSVLVAAFPGKRPFECKRGSGGGGGDVVALEGGN